ncbi:MAG: DUF4214 domain-containing protein [Acidimicrobiales bacterium]
MVLVLVIASTALAAPASAELSSPERQVAERVNAFRAEHGRPPVAVDAPMSADARAWSGHMTGSGLAHDAGFTRSCDRFPGYTACAENVGGAGDALAAQSALEGSAGHRSNLLCDCTHIGVGVATGGGRTYVTQRFVHAGTTPAPTGLARTLVEPSTFVRAGYEDFLGRTPTASELDHWSARVASAGERDAFVRTLAQSAEWVGALVDDAYRGALDREPDARGRRAWVTRILDGVSTPAEMVAALYASDEHFTAQGADLGPWVEDLYRDLIGRDADATGRSHWTAVAAARGRHTVSVSLHGSLESRRMRVDDLYRDLLGRPADGAGRDHWAGVLSRTGSDVALARALATSAEYQASAERRF